MKEYLILVNENDEEIGFCEKMLIHQTGKLHRAFSIFVFNSRGELLLQKRAQGKYHSAGLWTNTCCSHPHRNEDIFSAARRRLKEEMEIDCELKEIFSFIYKERCSTRLDPNELRLSGGGLVSLQSNEGGLIEHEYDHVLAGLSDIAPNPNKEEVAEFKYIALNKLKKDISASPHKYTSWLRVIANKHIDRLDLFLSENLW